MTPSRPTPMRRFVAACLAAVTCAAAAAGAGDEPDRLARAESMQAQGRRLDALRELEQAFAAARDAGDAPRMAQTAGALGKAHLLAGRPTEARRHLEFALAQADALALPALESAAHNDLGQLALMEGDAAQALRAFDAARQSAMRCGDRLLFARASLNAARQLVRDGRDAAANGLLEQALQNLAGAEDSEDKAYQLVAIAQLLARQDDPGRRRETAYRALTEAARIGARLPAPRAESFALGALGALYAASGRDGEGLALTRRALFLAQAADAGDALHRWHWQIARALAKAGREDEALAAYQRALASLRAVRQDLMADLRVSRGSYRDAVGPLFQEYADRLLRRAAAARAEERTGLLLRARDAIEQLKTVELEDYFQDACVTALQAKRKSLDEVPHGTAVLYPILLADRVELLVSLPDGIRQVHLGVDGRRLAEEAQTFRRLLEKRTTREYLPHGQRLYDWLLRPIEVELARLGIDTLVFVPDGPLRGIPLAALHDGRRFVIDAFAVAVAPGLTLVEDLPAVQKKARSLVGGITESVQNFPALPYVDPELASVQSVFGAKALKDAQFVIPNFERELQNVSYSVIHIASHGQIESDPRKSFLLAYDGKITMDNLEGYMKFGRFREDPVELLTLSACRTAAGDDRAALGLAGVAVKAGARSALATLWYVSDQASSMLVTEFYRELATGDKSKAQALRDAQRAVLADARYRHPGYWAPFLLIGNWQ